MGLMFVFSPRTLVVNLSFSSSEALQASRQVLDNRQHCSPLGKTCKHPDQGHPQVPCPLVPVPDLGLMVLFTMTSLWILAQPLTREV